MARLRDGKEGSSQAPHVVRSWLLLCIFSTASTSTPAQADDWPQFQHDAQHTGRSADSVPPNYHVKWAWLDKTHIAKQFVSAPNTTVLDEFPDKPTYTSTIIFSANVQPIIINGKAFFGSQNGTMYAVDAVTGDNKWDFTTGGPIVASAADASGVLIFGSSDGKIYALNDSDGSLRWSYTCGASVTAAPAIANGVVYIGATDGKFYAFDVLTGTLRWVYSTRDPIGGSNSPFNNAPIISPAAVSEDNSLVFFGAENMFFYGLNTSDGTEKWTPQKLTGQSFLYGWPVVKGNNVIVRTMSSLPGAEQGSTGIEIYLDPLCPGGPTSQTCNPTWAQEKGVVLNWLKANPQQKTMYVLDINTGLEPYTDVVTGVKGVAMGRVTGNLYTSHPPVVDNQNRVLTYWRSIKATFFSNPGSFGSIYCPDFSQLALVDNPSAGIVGGDRVILANPTPSSCPELDNGFQPTIGSDYVYFSNHFRGMFTVNLTTGAQTGISATLAYQDGGSFRWNHQLIYYGNDATQTDIRPPAAAYSSIGFAGIAIATTNGKTILYINEADSRLIAGIEKQ